MPEERCRCRSVGRAGCYSGGTQIGRVVWQVSVIALGCRGESPTFAHTWIVQLSVVSAVRIAQLSPASLCQVLSAFADMPVALRVELVDCHSLVERL